MECQQVHWFDVFDDHADEAMKAQHQYPNTFAQLYGTSDCGDHQYYFLHCVVLL